jgi:hypothetical protein
MWLTRGPDRILARGCYALCELACASTLVPFAVDAVVVYAPEPRSLFSCQAPAAETNMHLRTQIKQNKALASENNLPQSGLLVLLNRL